MNPLYTTKSINNKNVETT